ncbi:hypothetical protein FKM82_023133 [Ascaphus truei]
MFVRAHGPSTWVASTWPTLHSITAGSSGFADTRGPSLASSGSITSPGSIWVAVSGTGSGLVSAIGAWYTPMVDISGLDTRWLAPFTKKIAPQTRSSPRHTQSGPKHRKLVIPSVSTSRKPSGSE